MALQYEPVNEVSVRRFVSGSGVLTNPSQAMCTLVPLSDSKPTSFAARTPEPVRVCLEVRYRVVISFVTTYFAPQCV